MKNIKAIIIGDNDNFNPNLINTSYPIDNDNGEIINVNENKACAYYEKEGWSVVKTRKKTSIRDMSLFEFLIKINDETRPNLSLMKLILDIRKDGWISGMPDLFVYKRYNGHDTKKWLDRTIIEFKFVEVKCNDGLSKQQINWIEKYNLPFELCFVS